jgi:MarR family transcriptional regulator for hemolysin
MDVVARQHQPSQQPIGLDVSRTGRLVQRAFDDALTRAGGALATWLVVTALKGGDHAMQRDLAAAVGIEDATLTHHLNRMERDGLVERHRDPSNRRNQLVALTPAGEAQFGALLGTVTAFDRILRAGFSDAELTTLHDLLARLRANVAAMS